MGHDGAQLVLKAAASSGSSWGRSSKSKIEPNRWQRRCARWQARWVYTDVFPRQVRIAPSPRLCRTFADTSVCTVRSSIAARFASQSSVTE